MQAPPLDLSALESAVSALERSLDSWGFWLSTATALVVLGLILEYWHEVRDLLRERPIKWLSVQKIAGAVLVTLGVAGELWVQSKASNIETKLRSKSHEIEGSLNTEAANARRLASNAEVEAETLRRQNLSLQAQVIELRVEMADRHLSPRAREAVRSQMLKFPPQSWQVLTFSGDGEARGLSTDIEAALVGKAGAGWPTPFRLVDQTAQPIRGILVEFGQGADSTTIAAATALVNALRSGRLAMVDGPKPFSPPAMMQTGPGSFSSLRIGGQPSPNLPITVIIGRKP